jgi:hypothetical protein
VAQFVQAGLDRCAVQPPFCILAFRFAGYRPLEADFDSKFLGSRRVSNYLCDHSCEPRIMGAKDPLDFGPGIIGLGSNNGVTECVHVAMSPLNGIL